MENEIYVLAKYRLSKSKADLESAQLNFKNNLFSQSINRSYYAIFHIPDNYKCLAQFVITLTNFP
ncbi:MAG: HEPN domain-containing protein [Ignavibacteria bacterium]|nr:HEPN domain-containing protein [Ignavibacteria bacterium]